MRSTALLVLFVALTTSACGDDDDDNSGVMDAAAADTGSGEMDAATADTGATDAGPMDAMAGGENALGQLCGEGQADCPADHACALPPLVGASTTQGYCSPNCERTTAPTAMTGLETLRVSRLRSA